MILICYDGSPDAKAAIQHVSELLPGQEAMVLTVWQPFVEVLARSGFGFAPALVDPQEIDEQARKSAEEQAEEGARLAREHGLEAQPRAVQRQGTVAQAILSEADAIETSAVAIGSRGLTGLKSALLGSVSHAVLQQADRPVIVVPSPEVASARARHRLEDSSG
jgi:nucleotide-binding universal stress UspA family protein